MTPDEQTARIAARVAETAARRERRAAVRRELTAARTAGLVRRHTSKLDHLNHLTGKDVTPMTTKTFGAWLTQQTKRQDAIGDLARDYTTPCPCQPCAGRTSRRYSVAGVRAELDRHAAIPAAYDALDRAAGEWAKATR